MSRKRIKHRSTFVLSLVAVIILSFILININLNTNNDEQTLSTNPNQYYPLYEEYIDKDYVEYANKIVEGKLVVHETITDDVSFDIDQIDWDIQATDSPNTFSLYLHSLRPVLYLSRSYQTTQDEKYIKAAEKFIKSWNDYVESSGKKNRYTWYDHSVAERTENLIYFSILYKNLNKSQSKWIDEIIRNNAEWLSDDANYTEKHNHGIFQDGALIKAGYFLNDKKYIEKGVDRIDKQFSYAFPNKHVHIENSTGYHIGIISYIKRFSDFLSSVNNSYTNTALEYYNGALDYLVFVTKPNLALPLLGDTIGSEGSGSSKMLTDFKKYGNDQLNYIGSMGKSGVNPSELFKVYFDDGYAVFREHWRSADFNQSTWLLFKAGYLSSTHKHADDLSFVLYSKGHDIFIDPGMYNYMLGNEINDYTRSTAAHNSIIVDNQSYSVSMYNSSKVGLFSYNNENGYSSVTGYNNIFNGVNIDRIINYLDGNNFLIVDDISSDSNHLYTQNFHLSNDVTIVDIDNNHAILKIKDTNYYVLLQQLAEVNNMENYSGDKDPDHLSYISKGLNKVENTNTISFEKRASSTKFVTSIRIVDKERLENYLNKPPSYNGEFVVVDNTPIKVFSRKRMPELEMDVQINEEKVTLKNMAQSEAGLYYSFYLLDKDTGKKLESTSFSPNNSAEFKLHKSQSYAIIGYMRNSAKETKKGLLGYLVYENGKFIYNKLAVNKMEPIIKGRSIKKISNNTYNFNLDIESPNKINARWYIYKNGASYDFIANNNTQLQYTFEEPGIYTIIYRINDQYFGEFLYDNFEGITIK